MTDHVARYKELALRYLDVTVLRSQADEAALLAELDTLWWQMTDEEQEAIELWNATERGER
jgi:hypothetical protein